MSTFQCFFHGAWATRRRDDGVRGMRGSQGAGEMLTREHAKVVFHQRKFRFHVEMLDSGAGVTASGDTKRGVLNSLEGVERGVASVRRPDGGGVVNCWFDKHFVSAKKKLLLASPAGSGEGPEDVKLYLAGSDFLGDVGVEAKVCPF